MNTATPPTQPHPAAPSSSGPRVTSEQIRDLSRLRRARHGRMLAGVSEGLSRHLDIDPLLIRVVFGALTVFGGSGIVLYLLAWLTIPREDEYDSIASRALRRDPERTMAVGLVLAAISGAVTLLGAIGFVTPRPFAVITVSLVALVLFTVVSRRSAHHPPTAGSAFVAGADETGEHGEAQDPADPGNATTAAIPRVTPDERDRELRAWWQRPADTGGPMAPAPPGTDVYRPVPPPRPPRPKSRLTPITLAVMAVTLGGIWFADEAGADIHPSVYPGTVLGLTAAALLLGTWFGRAKLLIPIGVLSALLTAAITVIGPGPYGERIYTPTTASAVKDVYELGAGRIVLHLEEVRDLDALDGRTIVIDSHVGQVQVIVPTSLDAEVRSQVKGGDITGTAVIEDTGNGSQKSVISARGDGRPQVVIDVDLTYGEIEIFRADCPDLAIAQRGDTRSQDLSTQIWQGDNRVPSACN